MSGRNPYKSYDFVGLYDINRVFFAHLLQFLWLAIGSKLEVTIYARQFGEANRIERKYAWAERPWHGDRQASFSGVLEEIWVSDTTPPRDSEPLIPEMFDLDQPAETLARALHVVLKMGEARVHLHQDRFVAAHLHSPTLADIEFPASRMMFEVTR